MQILYSWMVLVGSISCVCVWVGGWVLLVPFRVCVCVGGCVCVCVCVRVCVCVCV